MGGGGYWGWFRGKCWRCSAVRREGSMSVLFGQEDLSCTTAVPSATGVVSNESLITSACFLLQVTSACTNSMT